MVFSHYLGISKINVSLFSKAIHFQKALMSLNIKKGRKKRRGKVDFPSRRLKSL